MGATVSLSSTTLALDVGATTSPIKVASTSGMFPGLRLFIDGEVMTVVSLAVDPWVNVRRGSDGTAALPHSALGTIYIARGDQLYAADPVGAPPIAIAVSPWINVTNGKVWFSQGDTQNLATRWWQVQTTTHDYGGLGVRTTTVDLTSST